MAARGQGRIVNISSVTGPVVTIDGSSAYATAKAAVTGPVATDAPFEIDGNFFTAQEEHAIPAMIGRVVEALK